MVAFAGVLRHELTRVGRPTADVTFTADERTVTFSDTDGRWRGPVPVAYGALVTFGNDEGRNGEFWRRLDREHATSA
ncbi:MAG TPA: hypothetical protein VLM79_38800 [Kofleriaceae bacterium]|nr:hypothetical protein [Kofleriaceae bacterium]